MAVTADEIEWDITGNMKSDHGPVRAIVDAVAAHEDARRVLQAAYDGLLISYEMHRYDMHSAEAIRVKGMLASTKHLLDEALMEYGPLDDDGPLDEG